MKELFKALASFQQDVPVIHKGTSGYGYSYADLPTIFEIINPYMDKHGLGFYQGVDGDQLTTTVFHCETGQSITQSANIPQGVTLKGMNDFQVLGSAITYMRRYQLSAMLGIVTDKDTDAAGSQESKKPAQPAKKPVENKLPTLTKEHIAFPQVEKYVAENGWDKAKKGVESRYTVPAELVEEFKALVV